MVAPRLRFGLPGGDDRMEQFDLRCLAGEPSVEVLLRVYAKCLDDGDDIANTRISAALRDA